MKSTEELRNDVLEIRDALKSGTLSNAVARTLLHGAKIVLDSVRLEMDATKLGADFSAVNLAASDRKKNKLRSVG